VKRMVITVSVAEYVIDDDLAIQVEGHGLLDATAWEWGNFWLDVENGIVGPDMDLTADPVWRPPAEPVDEVTP
jgi:purine nucleoside permease